RLRDALEKVLAVVEHDQRMPRAKVRDDRLEGGASPANPDTQRLRDRLADECPVIQRRELDPPRPVGKPLERVRGESKRETRLAAAASAGQRHQARVVERLGDRAQLRAAPDQLCGLRGKVVRDGVLSANTGEVGRQLRMNQTVYALRALPGGQPVDAEVDQ